jgi:hypothetical protein
MASVNGAKMEQQQIEQTTCIEAGNGIQVEAVKRFLYTLEGQFAKRQLSGRLQKRLMGSDGLQLLASAMTIRMTDYGGTTPSATSEDRGIRSASDAMADKVCR